MRNRCLPSPSVKPDKNKPEPPEKNKIPPDWRWLAERLDALNALLKDALTAEQPRVVVVTLDARVEPRD